MSKEKIYIFDTTLRDGAQTEGVDFTIEDKNKIARVLSDIGVDYIEGGWPGANPVDTNFFTNPPKMKNTLFTAFGMTKKTGRSADNDPGLSSLLNANTPAVCVVGRKAAAGKCFLFPPSGILLGGYIRYLYGSRDATSARYNSASFVEYRKGYCFHPPTSIFYFMEHTTIAPRAE